MKTSKRWRFAFSVLLLAAYLLLPSGLRAGDEQVTLRSLLKEMTSREELARLSDPAYKCLEASSHDRQKTDPADAKTWHSNKDYEQFIRTEENDSRDEWVIMEHQGPGAITRFWLPLNADRDKQVIRFYFDGSTKPAIEAPFNELLSGHGFVKPPLAFVAWDENDVRKQIGSKDDKRGVAGDLYLPIPFAKSCKITLDKLPFYYIINYRAYEPGANVKTFSMADYESAKDAIKDAGDELCTPADVSGPAVSKHATIEPGQELVLDLPPDGSQAIKALTVKLENGAAASSVRSLVLTGSFDGEQTIWCPLSEFFGSGARGGPNRDRFREATAGGEFTSSWIMPYQNTGSASRLALKNLGDKPVTASLAATLTPWKWDERSAHFHANWRCGRDIPTRPMIDWNYIDIKGRGHYVGDTLTVYNPVGDWYGEGDERIYVDGEKFPSHIGTGTEDYYGYAWGMADYFNSPFISMPPRDILLRDNWTGYTTTSRLRVLDAIPFRSGISHNMEIWNWADTHVDYAVGTFWYARPGATCNREPQPTEAAAALHPAPPNPRGKRPGAIEFETLKMVAHSPDLPIETQDVASIASGHWSEGRHLFVKANKVGDFVEFEVPVNDAGARKITLYMTKSYDYGQLHITVNGKSAGKDFDGFVAKSTDSGPIEIGTFEPVDGKLVLRFEVSGTNPGSKAPHYYFGLDCLTLDAVSVHSDAKP